MDSGQNIIVQKKDITTVQTVSSIEIINVRVDLDSSATFSVKMLDENGILIDIVTIVLSGQDYNNWGNDDEYVIDYILTQLDLVKA